MWRESLEQIPRMWLDEPYEFQGNYFRMPKRNVLPKPFSKPIRPCGLACSSPPTFTECGELGLGALCFTFGRPTEIAPLIKAYKEGIKRCKKPIGGFINDNIAVTTNMFCLPDGDQARRLYADAKVDKFTEYFFYWLDSIPRPEGLPKTGPVKLPPITAADLKAGLAGGGRQIGSPDEIVKVIKQYEEVGVGSADLCTTHAHARPEVRAGLDRHLRQARAAAFDKDPVHSTTRQRLAAIGSKAA
jgi:alkanesulfonate monooxygenase SsuD/methylene tetrahydromethanopterin reductase-like flavin-dependent oxidoreductase (luciferase family)